MTHDHDDNGLSRRTFLGSSAALAAAATMGGTMIVNAQDNTIMAVMPGVGIPDPAKAILEKQIGVSVKMMPYLSPTDSLAKLFAPGGTTRYDFMVTNMYFVSAPLMTPTGVEKLHEFDMSKIPNAADMVPLFKPEIQTLNGKTYMVPVYWGYDTPIFRTDKISEDDPITKSWGLLFDDKFAGHVALRDDAAQSIQTAALSLGHKDPLNMPQADLNEIKKFLISKKKNFRALWSKFGEAVNLMSSGEVWAMHGWMPMRAALAREKIPVISARPKEGILFWNHAAFIPKDTQKPELAYKMVNAMLSEEYGIAMTRESNYGPMNAKALATFTPEEVKNFGLDVTDAKTARFKATFPPGMNAWLEAWAAFKLA